MRGLYNDPNGSAPRSGVRLFSPTYTFGLRALLGGRTTRPDGYLVRMVSVGHSQRGQAHIMQGYGLGNR